MKFVKRRIISYISDYIILFVVSLYKTLFLSVFQTFLRFTLKPFTVVFRLLYVLSLLLLFACLCNFLKPVCVFWKSSVCARVVIRHYWTSKVFLVYVRVYLRTCAPDHALLFLTHKLLLEMLFALGKYLNNIQIERYIPLSNQLEENCRPSPNCTPSRVSTHFPYLSVRQICRWFTFT